MKHKVKMMVETEKQGFFGKKKVLQEKTVEVDGKTWQKMKKEKSIVHYPLTRSCGLMRFWMMMTNRQ